MSDEFWFILNVLGTIASIGSAVWAWISAKRARFDVTEARRVQATITRDRDVRRTSDLLAKCNAAISAMRPYGPTAPLDSARGVTFVQQDAKKVEDFLVLLSIHHRDVGHPAAVIQEMATQLHCLLTYFSSDEQRRMAVGGQILTLLTSLASRLQNRQNVLDDTIYPSIQD